MACVPSAKSLGCKSIFPLPGCAAHSYSTAKGHSLPTRRVSSFAPDARGNRQRGRAPALQVHAMRAVLQRVLRASVTVEGEVVSSIGPGLLVLVGISASDTEAEAEYM